MISLLERLNQNTLKLLQKVFSKLLAKGDIYLGQYEGWYCTHEETFWTDTQVGERNFVPECGRPVHRASEESYFFKTNKYVERLLEIF